jgi:hypothetical protein
VKKSVEDCHRIRLQALAALGSVDPEDVVALLDDLDELKAEIREHGTTMASEREQDAFGAGWDYGLHNEAGAEQARELGLYPDDQDLRIAFDQGADEARCCLAMSRRPDLFEGHKVDAVERGKSRVWLQEPVNVWVMPLLRAIEKLEGEARNEDNSLVADAAYTREQLTTARQRISELTEALLDIAEDDCGACSTAARAHAALESPAAHSYAKQAG